MGVVQGRTLTDALVAVLTAAGLLVGDGAQPAGSGWQGEPGLSQFVPYCILHAIPGGITDGTIANPDEDAQNLHQATCVGATRQQAEWVADVARGALTAPQAVTVAGRFVAIVSVDQLGGCRRDETVEPVVWMTADRFRVLSTP